MIEINVRIESLNQSSGPEKKMPKMFAVIGDPINHSLSPNIHSAAFRELNLDSTYIAYRIPKGELQEGVEALKKIKIDGFNVTIPHKIDMMKYLDKMDESCSVIGAVNTVTNNEGILKGYNTDMDGFLDPFKGKKIEKDVNNLENYDIIVNATSVGLKKEPSLISFKSIKPNTVVYDIVYMPLNTDFLKSAKEQNAIIIYGYEMLLGQAKRAFEIWHGIEAPYNAMKRALLGGV